MQPSTLPWYKGASKDAQQAIVCARTMQAKLEAIDTYIDSKLNVYLDRRMNPYEQSAYLQSKLQQLALALSQADAALLTARGDHFIENIAGLCNQWSLKSTFRTSGSATAAFHADRAFNWCDGLAIIKEFLQKSTHKKQGPRARFEAMREARAQVHAAIAFPKPALWEADLDRFMQQEALQGSLADPGFFSEAVASALNSAPEHKVAGIANRYFYSKIVAPWSVAVNQGHIDDKLYALLPQLDSSRVQHAVQDRANSCKRNMTYLHSNHIAHQSRHIHADEYAANFVQSASVSTSSQAASNYGTHNALISLGDARTLSGGICFVFLPNGACQIAREVPAC